MKTQTQNIFIVDENKIMAATLTQFLQNRFGDSVNITTFNDGIICLEKVDENTQIVILDYLLDGKQGLDILKSIKNKNQNTEVIILSGHEDIALAIESFRAGATDYVVKDNASWKRISDLVSYILNTPIRLLVREFGVSKFVAIFLTTFITMGIVVLAVLYKKEISR